MTYLGNAFSLQMLNLSEQTVVTVTPVAADEVASVDFESAVGHPDTAAVLTDVLKKDVAFNRVNVSLKHGDVLYVAQIIGGRLPEGSTSLPEGFKMTFVKVTL